ncbi:MAG: tRNA uridine-5-carboxymethylaminomethyl(34) synthesis enzyme MnmG [Eubacteriales bacterium]|nr:tRNA uridine-5-carboxymethylaminomethyl(34) synthesis enzyme MnmG [Eubacteriales bacterium]
MTQLKSLQDRLNQGAYLADSFDLIVVGAGHAGIEAAIAAATLGFKTALFTLHIDALANMPCNPNIGGTAKGQLVREIDALGGVMGKMADRHTIQFRMLNRSKGPAVLSPRAQQDRWKYQADMRKLLENTANLSLIQSEVTDLIWREEEGKKKIEGVVNKLGSLYAARKVILATGTFLRSKVIIGEAIYPSGPDGLSSADQLSQALRDMGLTIKRFKTGTPGRFHSRSLHFEEMTVQPADTEITPFSFDNEEDPDWRPLASVDCYLTYSTPESKRVIQDNIERSPLYSGLVEGVGPRYCPSFEDKVVKFPQRERHHVFLEPCGLDSVEIYASGLSSSMPEDVQRELVKTIPGMENAEFIRFAYAIDYDLLDAREVDLSLEVRAIEGLYAAGQILGSSGYEEAAATGLIAGINACQSLKGEEPIILDRSQAYIGVLIDDLVSKGTEEPYRMMTSRAEYRLLLRQDNADRRLTTIGRQVGLISDARWERFQAKQKRIEDERKRMEETRVKPGPELSAFLEKHNSAPAPNGVSLADLLKRPELNYRALAAVDPGRPRICWPVEAEAGAGFLSPVDCYNVEVEVKYAGYIRMEEERIAHFRKMEKRLIPEDFDYNAIAGLKLEAKQKLTAQRPRSVGQASRISGISPADISVLILALSQQAQAHEPKPPRKDQ